MKTNLKKSVERIETFRSAWEKNAPLDSFGGMTLEEFTLATQKPVDAAKEIATLRQEAKRKYTKAMNELVLINPLLERMVFSVQGNAKYGSDSSLYEELGYVRKSDRKKGLTRKPKVKPEGLPSTDAT